MEPKEYKYSLTVSLRDPLTTSQILDLGEVMRLDAQRLDNPTYRTKSSAVHLKWLSLSFLKAEIDALDDAYAGLTAIRQVDLSLIISKIESFLTQARSILDILVWGLTLSLQKGSNRESFNDFRKRPDLPEYFKSFIEESITFDPTYGLAENGWLNLLITIDKRPSLRDFVVHKGALRLLSLPHAYPRPRFGFFPLKEHDSDSPVAEVLQNIHDGMDEFFGLVTSYLWSLNGGKPEDDDTDPSEIEGWDADDVPTR